MKIQNTGLVIGLVIGTLFGNLHAAELDLTATPSFVTIGGKKYAIIQTGGTVTFSTSPSASATFSWTFNNGSPGTGSGTGPFTVTYSSSAAQGIANDVTFTATRSITGSNGNPITCTTPSKTTADVLVPLFAFSNTQSVTSSGVNSYITSGTTVSSGSIKISTDAKITLGVSGISIGTLSSAEDSNATFSPTSGTSDPFTTAFSSTDNTDQISMQFIPSSSATVVSQKINMTPADYQDLFKATVYFTTKQDGYSSTPTQTVNVYQQNGTTLLGSYTYPIAFLTDVKTEGYGKPTTAFNGSNPYVGWESSQSVFHEDTAAKDNAGNVLHPTNGEGSSVIHTCAYDNTIIPSNNYIKVDDTAVSSAFGNGEFHATDSGEAITGHHVDLYYGDDEPTSAGSGIPKDCSFTGTDSATEKIILVGPNS